MLPPRMPGDRERRRWQHYQENRKESGLEGRVVTLSQLHAAFPQTNPDSSENSFGSVELLIEKENTPYAVYGRQALDNGKPYGHPQFIAHIHKDHITVGPPRIDDIPPTASELEKTVMRGYKISCASCKGYINTVFERRT